MKNKEKQSHNTAQSARKEEAMNKTRKVLRQQAFRFKGTNELLIGDPLYTDRVNPYTSGTHAKNGKRGVYTKIPSAPIGVLLLQEVDYDGDPRYEAVIAQARRLEDARDYVAGYYYESEFKKLYDLYSESGDFQITTSYGQKTFGNNAPDDYYGDLLISKEYYGIILRLSFLPEKFTPEFIINELNALFPIQKIEDISFLEEMEEGAGVEDKEVAACTAK